MRHLLLKTAGVGACALALLAAYGPAKAFSPRALGQAPQLLIQVQDMETEAVQENLRPNLTPKGSEEQMPENEMSAPKESEGSSDIEDETIDKIVPE